ncbi:MAG: diadenylate cyclase CdaA [Clostridia bacterium]
MEFMNNIWSYIVGGFNFVVGCIASSTYSDILDVIAVTFLVFWVLKFVKNTRTAQVLKGIMMVVIFLLISDLFGMKTTKFIISSTLQFGVLAILIVFQPELRKVLEQVGAGSVSKIFNNEVHDDAYVNSLKHMISEVCNAAFRLSASGTGALIVFERNIVLHEIIDTGVMLNSDVSSNLLGNIFFTGAPLHDGAVIIRGDKIMAASCLLPLTQNTEISMDLGTRHRAAIGLSEGTDAIVVVVSEETSTISLASGGNLKRGFTKESLINELSMYLLPKKIDTKKEKKKKNKKVKEEPLQTIENKSEKQ